MSATQKKIARWKNQWQSLSKVFKIQVQNMISQSFSSLFFWQKLYLRFKVFVCVCVYVCVFDIFVKNYFTLPSSFVPFYANLLARAWTLCQNLKNYIGLQGKFTKLLQLYLRSCCCVIFTQKKNDKIYQNEAQENR